MKIRSHSDVNLVISAVTSKPTCNNMLLQSTKERSHSIVNQKVKRQGRSVRVLGLELNVIFKIVSMSTSSYALTGNVVPLTVGYLFTKLESVSFGMSDLNTSQRRTIQSKSGHGVMIKVTSISFSIKINLKLKEICEVRDLPHIIRQLNQAVCSYRDVVRGSTAHFRPQALVLFPWIQPSVLGNAPAAAVTVPLIRGGNSNSNWGQNSGHFQVQHMISEIFQQEI